MNKQEAIERLKSLILKSFGFDDEQIYYFKFIENEPASSGNEKSSS
jgi:hypothetical protein